LTYRNDGQYNEAMTYFNNALKMANAVKDSAWIAIAAGNIGSVYFLRHQYGKALPLIQADYRQSLKYDQKLNSAIALLRLVRINIDSRKYKQAGLQLAIADKLLLNTGEDVLIQRVQYYD